MARSTLCGPCRDAWMRWLDYRLPPAPINLVAIGRQDVRHIQERAEARFREWRDTIRWHQDHIAQLCEERTAREPLVKHGPRGRTGASSRSA